MFFVGFDRPDSLPETFSRLLYPEAWLRVPSDMHSRATDGHRFNNRFVAVAQHTQSLLVQDRLMETCKRESTPSCYGVCSA
jgi:hypothetical protein